MVQRRGKKNGIVSSSTIKLTTYYEEQFSRQGYIYEVEKGELVSKTSLNRNKRWEIIEQAPKIQPPISKEERKEKNRKIKKEEFQNHLETRGKHKEPPQKKEKEFIESKPDRIHVEGVYVTKNMKNLDRRFETTFDVENGVVVELPKTKKEIYLHRNHDTYKHDRVTDSPLDYNIDFKLKN